MGNEWREVTIAEIAKREQYSTQIGPFGSKVKAQNYTAQGVPYLRGVNVNKGRFSDDDCVFLSDQFADELRAFWCVPDDIVFVHRGTIGMIGIIPQDCRYPRYMLGNSMLKLTCDDKKANPRFVYYWFRSPEGQQYLFSRVAQTGVPAIATPLRTLRDARLELPPLAEQRAIARILGTLDDKIELNRRMNQTLEGLARALFQSWFVDFDPVTAKAAGRKPVGMSPASARDFPDTFEDSPLGPIPKGWRVCLLGEVIEIHDSVRVPLSGAQRAARQGRFPYYGAAGVLDHIDDYLFDGVYVLMGEDGSVINDDETPVLQYVWGQFWVNNHAHVLTAREPLCNEHLLLFLKQTTIRPWVTGAVQPKLNQGNLKSVPFLCPPDDVSRSFNKIVDSLYQRIRHNSEQSRTLAALRDSVLPRLLSGELRIKEAEKLLV